MPALFSLLLWAMFSNSAVSVDKRSNSFVYLCLVNLENRPLMLLSKLNCGASLPFDNGPDKLLHAGPLALRDIDRAV
ncbi:MAG: hypothetical protein JWO08_552, partial [Verrucomicrobiaceae bacterium]|nr:hypothetical protein [Verrucomicrobiaceae bacterium]